jgi:hypothetical protein
MRAYVFCVARLALLPGLLLFTAAGLSQQPEVTLKVVKYDGLADAVRQLRGKVVVVDFWADL